MQADRIAGALLCESERALEQIRDWNAESGNMRGGQFGGLAEGFDGLITAALKPPQSKAACESSPALQENSRKLVLGQTAEPRLGSLPASPGLTALVHPADHPAVGHFPPPPAAAES